MNLERLTKVELQDEFLRINHQYIRTSSGNPESYMNSKEFLNIREELHAILNELKRRREKDQSDHTLRH